MWHSAYTHHTKPPSPLTRWCSADVHTLDTACVKVHDGRWLVRDHVPQHQRCVSWCRDLQGTSNAHPSLVRLWLMVQVDCRLQFLALTYALSMSVTWIAYGGDVCEHRVRITVECASHPTWWNSHTSLESSTYRESLKIPHSTLLTYTSQLN